MSTTLTMPPTNILQRWLLVSRQPVRRGDWRRWRRVLAIGYILLIAVGVYGYFNMLSPSLVLGALALVYTPPVEDRPHARFRFGWAALLFTALFFVAPVKTVVYIAVGCAVCLYRESFFRRIPATTLLVLALLAPAAGFFADTFSFSIRMGLTSLAGFLIRLGGGQITVEGNTLSFRDHLFSVDPACMGLHMLIFSLLCALLLLNYFQRQAGCRLPVTVIALLLLLTTLLNIVANLLRIVCLVLLLILPENPLHGIFGLLLLGLYVLLPLLPMIRYAIRRYGHPVLPVNGSPAVRSRWVLAGNLVVAAAITLLIALVFLRKAPITDRLSSDTVPGYTLQNLPNNIIQLDNSQSMVYIKPIPGFYYTDHTPSICWEGSGYSFRTLCKKKLGGIQVFAGSLVKGNELLYTAWWYDNGVRKTINPFEWRWDLIRGSSPYAVVNVTCATEAQLEAEIDRIQKTHPFRLILSASFPTVKIW